MKNEENTRGCVFFSLIIFVEALIFLAYFFNIEPVCYWQWYQLWLPLIAYFVGAFVILLIGLLMSIIFALAAIIFKKSL